MSEERRKRQQQRASIDNPTPIPRKYFAWAGIALVGLAIYAALWYHSTHHYDGLAKCLASKGVKMYGLYWCPHCIDQKEKFGKSFQYIPYVECAVKGSREMAPECKAAGAKNFPTWQFPGEALHEGELSLDDLSSHTGCSLP